MERQKIAVTLLLLHERSYCIETSCLLPMQRRWKAEGWWCKPPATTCSRCREDVAAGTRNFHRCYQDKLRDATGCCWKEMLLLAGRTTITGCGQRWLRLSFEEGWTAEEGFYFSSKTSHNRDELLVCWDELLVMLIAMEPMMLMQRRDRKSVV